METMNSTDDRAAAIFFAEFLLPLAQANARKGVGYLDRGGRRPSYWQPVATRTGGLERLSSQGCGPSALLQRLGDYWAHGKEPELPQLLPPLEALRLELTDPDRPQEPEGRLSDFVYPIF
jgi:hypothetical protein